MTRPETRPASLLVVLAHPDDEAFNGGTLAHYAALGVRVTLACLTRGEAGRVSDPSLGEVADLPALREAELRGSCAALGIEPPVFLDFHDSGPGGDRLRHDDPLATMNVPTFEIEARLLPLIEALRPQVMLTFDPHGGYGHPDHLSAHRAATAAFFSSGRFPGSPRRLFYTAMPAARVRAMQASGTGLYATLDPDLYGVSEDTVAVTMDVSAQLERKVAALAAHRSQTGPNSNLGRLPPAEREKIFAGAFTRETFSLAATRGPVTRWPLRGLFDGLFGLDLE
jgi:N-acetyl-1-D-myo-inositol-2-amino-2-deoxy-alpha-D-glucopyranoside deacetylase